MLPTKLVVWLKDVGKEDGALVGGKGANLGEMTQAGFPVPNGFIVTSTAYYQFLRENDLQTKITHLLGAIDYANPKSLEKASKNIKKLIIHGKMSEVLIEQIFQAYELLSGVLKNSLVAVRSSATAEDLPNASFAGQQETFLNVKGEANLLLKIKDAWASLFDSRAIFYRHEQKYDHFKIGIAIPVQKMVESDASGVMFTLDPVTNDKSKIVIEAIYGLGEYIVQGIVTPDHYEIDKHDLAITYKKTMDQKIALVKKGQVNKKIKISKERGAMQKISNGQIVQLAELGKKLEHHYYFPQDAEWAIENDKVFLVQTRPITTIQKTQETTNKKQSALEVQNLKLKVILHGDPASPGIASGPVRILKNAKEIGKIKNGDILVAPQTNPDFVPAMKKAVAIVTDKGGRTSHAAIVSREIGIPAVVGTEKATTLLKDGEIITVDGAKGEVYQGGVLGSELPLHDSQQEASLSTATKVYVNLAEPEFAEKIAQRHVDGVGLLRAEFMMANIGVHPKKMIRDGKSKEYIMKLATDIENFCKAFSPRPVIYRTSDFKTNEYRDLVGGKEFEPEESNPMLGYRGAFRYMHDPEVFHLELEAIKHVRNTRGFKNLWLMLPFVRTVEELLEVKKIIASCGLYRSPSFQLWMMVEIPSNVILLDEFIQAGIDGVSIGSNDLTMLLLGTDRDNSEVAPEFNEQNDAVLWAFEKVIRSAHAHKITSSLCGQAASEYPELLEKLVKWGVTSVSVSPDVIETTRERISQIEKKLLHG